MSTPAESADAGAGLFPATAVRAWDLPTRLSKWGLVLLVGLAFVSRYWGDSALVWHMWNGLLILVLVVFRLLWGFVGGSTTRFSAFVSGPRRVAAYAADLLHGRPRRFLGHNPLGGWMVVALLLTVAAQAAAGLFTTNGVLADGPLVWVASEDTVSAASALHGTLYIVLLVLVGLHIAANVFYSVVKKDNLILAMLTGRKPAAPYEDQPEATAGSVVAALGCLAVAAVVVFGGIALAGGNPFP